MTLEWAALPTPIIGSRAGEAALLCRQVWEAQTPGTKAAPDKQTQVADEGRGLSAACSGEKWGAWPVPLTSPVHSA